MTDAGMTAEDAELAAAARRAAATAYAPYSDFVVGAAVRLADGTIVPGANVENASYGLSLCAETVAVAAAAASGRMAEIVAIAVSGGRDGRPLTPCGRCRQILAEAATAGGRDIAVVCAAADGSAIERHMLSALLPHAFDAGALAAG